MEINIKELKKEKSIQELLEFGILNIDKPCGPTSFNISDIIRKKLGLRKTSHFGTLDPKVTGVLPIALNRACKLTGFFIGEKKEYIGIMRFHNEISLDKLKDEIKKNFIGKIKQTPPVKSRVKRQEREREIYNFEILEQKEKDFLFKVCCQGGTYIRKLVDDLGSRLGISAHMLELRRTKAGIFSEENKKYPSVDLYKFEKAVNEYKKGNEEQLREILIPAEIISELYSVIEIKSSEIKRLLTGKFIYQKDLIKKKDVKKNELVCVFSKKRLIGIYRVIDKENIFAKPEFVLQPISN